MAADETNVPSGDGQASDPPSTTDTHESSVGLSLHRDPPTGALQNLHDAARAISASSRSSHLNETELVNLFFQIGFFSTLQYGTIGQDIRLEKKIERGRVDLILRSFTGSPIALLEFKRPGTELDEHVGQLERYATELLPAVAVLTNGNDFWLYLVTGDGQLRPPQKLDLAGLTIDQARLLYRHLRRRQVDWRYLIDVSEVLDQYRKQPVRITAPDQAGGRQFLQRFALSEYSPFGRLTRALTEALPPLIHRSEFARGAYEFWRQAYARNLSLEDTPANWRSLIIGTGQDALYRFMFALETAYTFLSRTLLAKAMADAEFPHLDAMSAFKRALEDKQQRGFLELVDYLGAAQAVFGEAKRQAFDSLFATDIFDWWQDAGQLGEAVGALGESVAEAVVAIFEFDFAGLSGDLLGTLYQSYFDPETRKALGEFYTPPEVVKFILDEVGYQGPQIRTQRLLNPSRREMQLMVWLGYIIF